MGCYSPCRGMYLELRPRPMSREHARPQPPAGSRRYGGGTEEPAPVPVGVTGYRTQRSGQVGPPGPRSTPSPSQLPPGPRGRTVRTVANISCSVQLACWLLADHPAPAPSRPLLAITRGAGVCVCGGGGRCREPPAACCAKEAARRGAVARGSAWNGGGELLRTTGLRAGRASRRAAVPASTTCAAAATKSQKRRFAVLAGL
jgi:hypothetical protein